jgi:hypothetical protein|tara:strand:- start:114 stop:548 length:435 start_codon:yes stop_codon:yes gene_type:complete
MKKITIDDLKQTSKLWCEKQEKKFSEDNLYHISPHIILDNMFYNKMSGLLELLKDGGYYYRKIYDDIKENGWNKKYPARIGIGDKGEIYTHGGNHRMNILTKLNLDYVVFQFVYQKNIETHVPVFLETGKNFYPNGLLPKWDRV